MAREFDGISDVFTSDSNMSISGSDDRSFVYWMKTSAGNLGSADTIVSHGTNGSMKVCDVIYPSTGGDKMQMAFFGGNRVWNIGTNWDNGSWHHYAFIFSGTQIQDWSLYYDGAVASIDSTASPTNVLNTGISQWYVGNSSSQGSRYADINVADCRVYNRAITAAEVAEIHSGKTHTVLNGLVLWYPFMGDATLAAIDRTGNNNGTFSGTSQDSSNPRIKI